MTAPDMPLWERRFRAPSISGFDWSPHAPDRIVFVSSESGIRQVHVWDRASGMRRQVTDHPVGVINGVPTLDGDGVSWFQDETGDESGRWLLQPFAGGKTRPLIDGLPHGWSEGLTQAPGVVAAAMSNSDGFSVHVAIDAAPAREIYRSAEPVRVGAADRGGFCRGGLSADGSLLCLEHAEHGDLIHPALRVIDPRTGEVVGEQHDEGMAVSAACWSPLPGDPHLAIIHETEGEARPAIWDLATGERTDLRLGLEGIVDVQDWWPDGSAMLLVNLHEGRHRLLRYDIDTGELSSISTPQGTIRTARVRPGGSTWCLVSQSRRPPLVIDDRGAEVMRAEGDDAPPGRPYVSWSFATTNDRRLHGFHVTPEGEGPFPVIMFVHGGPTSLHTDTWEPEVQAYVDAGFAVGMVNYRGSIGYGREWRDTLVGNIGGPELEDVNAGLADLRTRGIADPTRAVIAGWSWGGYVTLLELGKHTDLWLCGVAGVPVADYEASYDDMSPLLQAYDRALLGAAPKDVPALMLERNPINFVDDVKAPVLIIAGENDSRCPIRQVRLYLDRLKARSHPHEAYVFSTGHGSLDIGEAVRQMRVILDFLARHVPGSGRTGPRRRR